MTCCASSFTAPVWSASDWAFCCFSSQSLARANETGSRGAGLSDVCRGCFLSAVQRSLYCCSKVLAVMLTRPLWGIACHNSSQMASMLLLKSGGTHVESPLRAYRRDMLRQRPEVASGSGTLSSLKESHPHRQHQQLLDLLSTSISLSVIYYRTLVSLVKVRPL